MKKTFLALLLAGVMTLPFGCTKDDPQTPPPSDFDVSLAISDVTDEEASVTATVSDETTAYVLRVISDKMYQQYDDMEASIADYLNVLWEESAASNPGKTQEELVTLLSSTGKGTFHATDLNPETKYWAFAVAVDAQGVPTQTATVKEFTTKEEEKAEIAMTIDVTKIETTTATIAAMPGDAEAKYYFSYLSDADYQKYGGTREGITEYLKTVLWPELSAENPDVSIERLVAEYVTMGEDTFDVTELKPATKYWAVAAFVDAKGVPTQTATVKEFTTKEIAMTVEVTNIKATSAIITTTPGDDKARYCIDFLSDADYQKYGGKPEGITEYWTKVAWPELSDKHPDMSIEEIVTRYTWTGANTLLTELKPVMKYWAVAAFVDAKGVPTQTATVKEFTTKEIAMTIEVTKIRATSATITTTPGDDKAMYYFNVISDTDYQQYGGKPEGIAKYMEEVLGPQYELMGYLLTDLASIGNDFDNIDKLTPATKYWAFAVYVDAEGVPTQPATMKEFTTKDTKLRLTLSDLEPGDFNGEFTDTKVHLMIYGENVVSGKMMAASNDAIADILAMNYDYEDIIERWGTDFSKENIDKINDETGVEVVFRGFEPGEEACVIVQVVDADGNKITEHRECKTSAAAAGTKGRTFAPAAGEKPFSACKADLSSFLTRPAQASKF